jgi:hypothetical protein
MMELERLKPGQSTASVAMADPIQPVIALKPVTTAKPIKEKPVVVAVVEPIVEVQPPKVTPVVVETVPKIEVAPVVALIKPTPIKEVVSSPVPAPYFRNFQIFESRVVALSEVGKERLREWAELFKSGGYKSVTINGYTDNIPPQRLKALYATNEILSEARAKIVADYLMTQGVQANKITVNGMGDVDPVAPNESEEGRSKNRRIEFILSR